jgi:hypothetical protein
MVPLDFLFRVRKGGQNRKHLYHNLGLPTRQNDFLDQATLSGYLDPMVKVQTASPSTQV